MVVRLYNTVNLNSTNYGVGRAFVPKTKPITVGRTQGLYKYSITRFARYSRSYVSLLLKLTRLKIRSKIWLKCTLKSIKFKKASLLKPSPDGI